MPDLQLRLPHTPIAGLQGEATGHSVAPRRSLRRTSIALALLCSTPWLAPSIAADDAAALEPLSTVEGISEYRLDNGLTVLLFPDPSVSTVTVNVTYLVGSRHEGRGEAGMAHLLEHMVFKGTPTYENIWGALQDHGASFNGTTWVDRTNYYETLDATQENLDFALAMEADRMVNSSISAEELAKEMTVVRNEFEMGENDPISILEERMLSAAFLWHNYGKSTIGNRSDLERVPVENLRRFYEKYYQPDNAMLVVAGNFEPEWTLARIQNHFSAIPRPQRALQETYTEEPVQDGPRAVVLRRVGSLAAAGAVYHTPAGSHPDSVAIDVLGEVLTGRPSGRLYEALVEGDKAASTWHRNYSWHDPAVIVFMSSVRLDQYAVAAQRLMLKLVEGTADSITEAEVERARTKLLREVNLGMTDSRRVGILLSEWQAMGDWRLMFLYRDRLERVSTDDVNRVAGQYLLASNRTSGLFLPTDEPVRAEIPATPDVAELVGGYTSTDRITSGASFETTAANIEATTWRGQVAGMQVALLPKHTRGNVVRAELVFRFGSEETLTGRSAAISLLPDLMMRGTRTRDYQAIQDEMNRIESEISLFGGTGAVVVAIKTTRKNLQAALDLVTEVIRYPTFPNDELDVLRQQRLARLERSLSDPQGLVFVELARALRPYPPDSIHYEPSLDERVERTQAVTREEIVELHTRLFGAEQAAAAFVGDFDPETVKRDLEEALGDWRAEVPYSRIAEDFRPIEAQDLTIDTPDKKMAIVVRGAPLELREDDPAYPVLRFANYILGLSPKSRLLTALRHEGGLSYGANSILSAHDVDRVGQMMAYAICAPENAVETQRIMQEEFQRWVAEPISEEELAEFRLGYEREFKTSLGNDAFLARQLLEDLRTDRPFTFHRDVIDEAARFNSGQIHEILKETVGAASFVEIKGGDVSKFAEEGS